MSNIQVEKIVFTPEMLRRNNFGLFLIKDTVDDVTKRPGYSATVSWKLGYINHKLENSEKRYGLISFLTDGWFYPAAETIEELCDYINDNPHGVSYRLMTKEEVIFLLTTRKQGFL